MSDPSQSLIKRPSDSSLMPPPPPPKRIKRPATVLDEDVYTNALSEIIARDYFPGLLENQVKQEYLDALDSQDKEWISSSKKKLSDLLQTPARARSCPGSAYMKSQSTENRRPDDTPMGWGGDTPLSVTSALSSGTQMTVTGTQPRGPDVSRLGLLEFQAKYTSEDNESFNKILDKRNAKHRERYAWLWNGNKMPTTRQTAHHRRETKRIEAQGGNPDQNNQVLIKTDLDARPAQPNTWKIKPDNSLMFAPSSVEDTHETIQQKAEAASRAAPKCVVYQNTRLPDEALQQPFGNAPPPSPSISAINDAIAGRPRPTDSEPGYIGSETPRVNGYAFVDEDEPEYDPGSTGGNGSIIDDSHLLGTSDATPNPFLIKENRKREDLHHRMVDRVARTRRAEKVVRETKSPVVMTPRFASSPRLDFGQRATDAATPRIRASKMLTPAAQKLLSQVGSTPRSSGLSSTSSSNLRNIWTPTPRKGK
ncbi:splicing factor ESS-2 family protein [Aspergillus homomorphus CBS 101889]|uniref:Nuclear protein Es2 n=1 Tax=Aspergillus homomorphus (strain CBS 101889) TaxID=1450537 RepID=A0A395HRS0_ASPHC|nr:nuclear protein Es2 [Aspergillus homomorphus CBS 101889]RAL10113.1 nuclear protein Es2 [Aspergillus homomorphus CBS 101889]